VKPGERESVKDGDMCFVKGKELEMLEDFAGRALLFFSERFIFDVRFVFGSGVLEDAFRVLGFFSVLFGYCLVRVDFEAWQVQLFVWRW
jgi:hypothetical protein